MRHAGTRPTILPFVTASAEPDGHDLPSEPFEPVAGPGGPASKRMRRLDGRTRTILSIAAVAAVIVNAGAVWAYWRLTGSTTGTAAGAAGTRIELMLRGSSDYNKPLVPGGTGNLTVTVTNDNTFPIRISSVSRAAGTVIADAEHRDEGCLATGVSVTKASFVVSWNVPKNTIGAFTVRDGLAMSSASHPACAGATFTVPVRAAGIVGSS